MKKAPALPLFGDAYLADTRHLSLEEHGAYLQLLLIAWRTDDCRLPDDDARLARMLGITPKKWIKLKPSVMAFWTLADGAWEQKRLTKERRFVAKKSEQNAEAANARWNAKSLQDNEQSDANASFMQCERNAPSPSPTSTLSNLPKQKAPDGAYAFVGRVIRLKADQFEAWRKSCPHLDLTSRLQQRDDWLATEADDRTRKSWFISTSNWLANQNQKAASEIRARPVIPI